MLTKLSAIIISDVYKSNYYAIHLKLRQCSTTIRVKLGEKKNQGYQGTEQPIAYNEHL